MNELSITVLWAVGRTTILLVVAALFAGGLLAVVRSSSPTVHRMAWSLVLVVGWLFPRLPVAIPYGESLPLLHASATVDEPPMAANVDRAGVSNAAVSEAVLPPADATHLQAATPRDVRSSWILPGDWHWPAVLLTVWMAGILCLPAGWTAGYVWFVFRLRRERSLQTPAEADWAGPWEDLLARRGVRRVIPMRVTTGLGPMLCRLPRGYCLLVPRALWRGLTPSGRLAILRHELAHYQRADTWKSLAVRLLALPHWFNPAAWWAVRRFDSAAEWACDRRAIDACPEEVTHYARTLVEIGELAGRWPSLARAFRGCGLSVRVRRLLDSQAMKEDSIMKKTLVIGATFGLVAVCLIRFDLVPADAQTAKASVSEPQTLPSGSPVSEDSDKASDFAQVFARAARPKETLRYDGKSFDEWRDELEAELKPELRTEAIKAFAAFGANGYGREAAEVILGVMRGYDVTGMNNGPMGELKDAATSAFRNPAIDRGDGITPIAREDALPVLLEELKHGTRNGRLFVVNALPQMALGGEEVIPLLIQILEKEEDATLRDLSMAALSYLDKKGSSAPALLEIVRDAKAGALRQKAFWALSAVDQDGESIADGLRAMIREGDARWFQNALGNLIPTPGSGRGGVYGVGQYTIFKMPESSGGFGGGMMPGVYMGMGGGFGGGSTEAPQRELAPKAGPVIKVIVEAMDHEQEAIRQAAFQAVARIGTEAKGLVGELVQRIEKAPEDDLVLIVKALGEIGPAAKEAVPVLVQLVVLRPPDEVRQAAYSALIQILKSREEVDRFCTEARRKHSEASQEK
jgi:beta-lactamase regulating signal transducer with metallopeptidase domain